MKVSLKTITPEAEKNIVEIARVSSSRQDKTSEPDGLVNYLIKNKHWSPFEHASVTFDIECSKAIGIQLIRHRSFTFQEFSQRYQNVSTISEESMFEHIELRKQATNNRQSSEEVFDPTLLSSFEVLDEEEPEGGLYYTETTASEEIAVFLDYSRRVYENLLAAGVAREQARLVLPLATKTRIYMTGTVRSWIHFLELRDDSHAQKEAQQIAVHIKRELMKQLPMISKALSWEVPNE